MIKILVAGQTPPPYHGQAIMIGEMLKARYEDVKMYHVRMRFSREIDELGKFRLGKVLHLFGTILKIIFQRLRHNIKILYYPPAGPDKTPVIRDLIILLFTRFLFKRIIFHFHAAGLSTMEETLPPFLRRLFRSAYYFPDVAIRLSELNPEDGRFLHAKREFIIPYGIDDNSLLFTGRNPDERSNCRLLYVGMIKKSKGILVLLEACRRLKERDLDFRLTVVGEFGSRDFQRDVTARVSDYRLGDNVEFMGGRTGQEKYALYSRADIFCYPTYYEHESFGIVLLEAMQFSLPVVSTQWRGVPSVVRDGVTGFCVPVKDSVTFADKLESLMKNPELRLRMGEKGRDIYLNSYTTEEYQDRMRKVFLSAADKI